MLELGCFLVIAVVVIALAIAVAPFILPILGWGIGIVLALALVAFVLYLAVGVLSALGVAAVEAPGFLAAFARETRVAIRVARQGPPRLVHPLDGTAVLLAGAGLGVFCFVFVGPPAVVLGLITIDTVEWLLPLSLAVCTVGAPAIRWWCARDTRERFDAALLIAAIGFTVGGVGAMVGNVAAEADKLGYAHEVQQAMLVGVPTLVLACLVVWLRLAWLARPLPTTADVPTDGTPAASDEASGAP